MVLPWSIRLFIIVGDIDPDKIEASIKRLFNDLKPSKEATKATPVMVDDNNNTLYAFGSNKEVSQEIFQLYRKIEYIAPEEKKLSYVPLH